MCMNALYKIHSYGSHTYSKSKMGLLGPKGHVQDPANFEALAVCECAMQK